ncbi:MAG: MBL fold metallo-hydrolase [Fermentimonas sp.]|jgi:L-ascorbate metabolism protein UlaG (beta-lactamase superfamily)|nr:MBL fold metallo-hydrolase [Fermentimonas sp.]NLC86696.1 MBL fold metallo-hydrolase [Bacteroidales bacterium]HBT86048.1 hydrolase [Porphyromonadaceae bacterium]MDD2931013.1 MBL fold metallo-hydrolase [Fermentimonas sp.]MDD3188303.1 MBL fold metallo-hydrolase [Fermentimonas sp.]
MTITYIYHSCYLIEFKEFSLLFDFYKDVPREDGKNWITDYLLKKEEDLYVFCSHSHSDHFNPEIFSWRKRKKNLRYIFSDELLESKLVLPEDANFLRKEESYRDHRIKVKAFGSTDVGGSFLISYDDKLYFHAGDLNNWHWKEEVSSEEALAFENNFLCELELLSEKSEDMHVVMFPIDPRLGKDFMRGAEQFISRIKTDYILPMHFGDKYNLVNKFGKLAEKYNCNYLPITHQGQSYNI